MRGNYDNLDVIISTCDISLFFVKLVVMRFINTKTEKYFLILLFVALITLFGIFYFKGGGSVLQPEESDSISQSEEVFLPEKTSYEEYLQQGIQYESAGELDKAIDAYQKAAKANPESYVPYSNIGSIYRQNKEFYKAEGAFRTALSIAPQSVSVYRKLYELYRYDFKKHPDQMALFFSDALKQTNNDVDLMKLYAFYLEDINDLFPALAIWKAFLQAEPNNELYTTKVKSLEERIAN